MTRRANQGGSGDGGSAQPGSPGLESPAAIEEQTLPPACDEGQPSEPQTDASDPTASVRDNPADGTAPSGDPDGNADQQAESPTGDANPDSGEPAGSIDSSKATGDEPASSADCEEPPTGTDLTRRYPAPVEPFRADDEVFPARHRRRSITPERPYPSLAQAFASASSELPKTLTCAGLRNPKPFTARPYIS